MGYDAGTLQIAPGRRLWLDREVERVALTAGTVLIVEDDPHFSRLVTSVTELCGFRAHVAASAREVWASGESAKIPVDTLTESCLARVIG